MRPQGVRRRQLYAANQLRSVQRRCQRWGFESEPVVAFIEPSQVAGAAGCTDWGGGEGVGESNTPLRQPVDAGGYDNRVTGATEEVSPLVVGEDKEDVRRGG